jgi:GNAT superfamily N-acetyltransferase
LIRSCPQCNKDIIYQSKRGFDDAVKNNSLCHSCSAKRKWKNSEYEKKQNKIKKCLKFKKEMSKKIKKLWENSEYREKQTELQGNPEYRELQSQKSKEAWENPKYREKRSKQSKEAWENPEYREKRSKQSKEAWENPEYREKHKKIWEDPEYRKKQSQTIKERWKNPEFKEKMAIILANQPKVSSIQTILYSILDDLNIAYFREWNDRPDDLECRFKYYNFDCVIPREGKTTLLIECQGDYWHSLPKGIKNDKSNATYMERYYPEYEIKYLWEHEFSCKDKIVELIKYWTGQYKYELIQFDFKDLEIKKPKPEEYRLLLSKYHYLPNAGRGGIAYGAYLSEELISVVVFSPPIRQNIDIGKKFLELSRFCVHPKYQKKNLGSWFISRAIKLLKEEKPDIEAIVSYCDTTFNHDGALYKSLNFVQDKIIEPDYWYVSIDGYPIHKKTLYNRATRTKMKEIEFAEKYNYKKVWGMEKLRFILEYGTCSIN